MIAASDLEQYVYDQMEGLDEDQEWGKGAKHAYLTVLQLVDDAHQGAWEDEDERAR